MSRLKEKTTTANTKQGYRLATGFLFTAFLIVALFSFHVYKLTSFETIEKVGVAASHELIDIQAFAELYYPEFAELARKNPDKSLVVPGIGLDLKIKAGEMSGVSRDEIGDFVARAVIKRIYNEGFSNVYDMSSFNGANAEDLHGAVDVVDTFINKDFNRQVFFSFVFSALMVLLLAIPFFLLSPGMLKLTGFGGSFIIAGVPGLFIAVVQQRLGQLGGGAVTSALIDGALMPFLYSAEVSYLGFLLVGMGLFLAGVSGMFITRRKAGNR